MLQVHLHHDLSIQSEAVQVVAAGCICLLLITVEALLLLCLGQMCSALCEFTLLSLLQLQLRVPSLAPIPVS